MFSLVQPAMKIQLMKIFDNVSFRYENNTCDVHTKTAIFECSALDLGLLSRCQFDATSSRRVVFGSRRVTVNTSANASDPPVNKAVKKAIVNNGLGKKRSQFMSTEISSFVNHCVQKGNPCNELSLYSFVVVSSFV